MSRGCPKDGCSACFGAHFGGLHAMALHLHDQHPQMIVDEKGEMIVDRVFQTNDDYEKWLEHLRREEHTDFAVIKEERRKDSTLVQHLMCTATTSWSLEARKRGMEQPQMCTAALTVRSRPDGTVEVDGATFHIGHNIVALPPRRVNREDAKLPTQKTSNLESRTLVYADDSDIANTILCTQCGTRFQRHRLLLEHVLEEHNFGRKEILSRVCRIDISAFCCNTPFVSVADFEVHQKVTHSILPSKVLSIPCPIAACSFVAFSFASLYTHCLWHSSSYGSAAGRIYFLSIEDYQVWKDHLEYTSGCTFARATLTCEESSALYVCVQNRTEKMVDVETLVKSGTACSAHFRVFTARRGKFPVIEVETFLAHCGHAGRPPRGPPAQLKVGMREQWLRSSDIHDPAPVRVNRSHSSMDANGKQVVEIAELHSTVWIPQLAHSMRPDVSSTFWCILCKKRRITDRIVVPTDPERVSLFRSLCESKYPKMFVNNVLDWAAAGEILQVCAEDMPDYKKMSEQFFCALCSKHSLRVFAVPIPRKKEERERFVDDLLTNQHNHAFGVDRLRQDRLAYRFVCRSHLKRPRKQNLRGPAQRIDNLYNVRDPNYEIKLNDGCHTICDTNREVTLDAKNEQVASDDNVKAECINVYDLLPVSSGMGDVQVKEEEPCSSSDYSPVAHTSASSLEEKVKREEQDDRKEVDQPPVLHEETTERQRKEMILAIPRTSVSIPSDTTKTYLCCPLCLCLMKEPLYLLPKLPEARRLLRQFLQNRAFRRDRVDVCFRNPKDDVRICASHVPHLNNKTTRTVVVWKKV